MHKMRFKERKRLLKSWPIHRLFDSFFPLRYTITYIEMATIIAGIMGLGGFGMWLNHVIPNKPPKAVDVILGIPDDIKDGAHQLTTPSPPSIESYQQHSQAMKQKYKL